MKLSGKPKCVWSVCAIKLEPEVEKLFKEIENLLPPEEKRNVCPMLARNQGVFKTEGKPFGKTTLVSQMESVGVYLGGQDNQSQPILHKIFSDIYFCYHVKWTS